MPHKRAKQSVRSADRKAKGSNLPPTTNDIGLRDVPKGAMRILNAAKVQEEFKKKKRERKEREKRGRGTTTAKAKDEEGGPLRIKMGEKMGDFSRRVERAMAADIHASFKATRTSSNKKRKRKAQPGDAEAGQQSDERSSSQVAAKQAEKEPDSRTLKEERVRLQARMGGDSNEERDWQKASQRRRINDVVEAPPSLTKAPRGQSTAALQRKAELKALLQGGKETDADLNSVGKARLPDPVQPIVGLRRQAELEQERQKAVKAYRQAKERRIEEKERRTATSS